jgi:hypothetical protein
VESNIKVLCLLSWHTPLAIPKNFKHNFFFSDQVPIDPSNATSSSQNLEPLIMFIDLAQIVANLVSNKKKKKIHELNCHLQDSWAIKLPWAESIVGTRGKSHKSNARFVRSLMGEIGFW